MKVKESFEKQLSEMCVFKINNESVIFIGENRENPKRYYPETIIDYLSVKVSADCLRKGLVKLFSDYSKNFASSQDETYYNETYFFHELSKLLFCLSDDKSKDLFLVDYYKAVVDAFLEIHKNFPNLDPGFFETMLYSCVIKIDDDLKLKGILDYYDKNRKAKFENFPDYVFSNKPSSFNEKYYEKQMIELYINVINKLGVSEEIEDQELYSSLLKNTRSDIIMDVIYYENNLSLNDVNLLHINSEITDSVFSDKDLLQIKEYFHYCGSLFDETINELLIKRINDDEKVFKIFAKRIFTDFRSDAVRVGNYTNKSFDEDNFYLNLNLSKIDLLVKKACRFYASQNRLNLIFTELGFHNGIEREERMRSYLLMRKENAIVKDFTNKLIKEESSVNRKRL